jgi:membrane protease YdiL (CAAX protease family)
MIESVGLMINKPSAFSILFSMLFPILVLLTAIFFASVVAYLAVSVFGDDISFRTTFKRFSQFFLVFSIFPLMAVLKLNRIDLGFASRPIFFKQLIQGIGLGIITLLPVLAVLYMLGIHVIDDSKSWTLGWLGKKLVLELLLAMLISLVEEPIFRGILLTGLSKKIPVAGAIVLSAFYYAGLHFVNSNIEIPTQNVGLFSGFILLDDALAHLFNKYYLSAFFSLFVVGVFLGLLRTQVNVSLGLCVGCHACWVWQIKLSKIFFNTNTKSDYLFLVSGYDGVIGSLVTAWLSLAIISFIWYRRNQRVTTGAKKSAEET